MKNLFLLFIGMTLLLIGVFVTFPEAVGSLGFSGEHFFNGEYWRIFTYPLAHVSFTHLFENLIALFIVILLSYELELDFKEFLFVFLGSGVLIALFSGAAFPYFLIVGSSLGIYSIFGALSLKDQEIMPRYAFFGIFGIIIFLNVVYTLYLNQDLTQPAYHVAGFVTGFVFVGIKKLQRKKRILE